MVTEDKKKVKKKKEEEKKTTYVKLKTMVLINPRFDGLKDESEEIDSDESE